MVVGKTKGEKVFQVVNYILLSILGIAFFIPYLMVFIASFMSESAFYLQGYTLFPKELSLEAYGQILQKGSDVYTGLLNSVFITVVGTIIQMAGTVLAIYPLSKKHLVGRKVIMKVLVFSMLFSGGLIPSYMLMVSLGLKNSYLAIFLPSIFSVWNGILIRNYFQGVPDSLEEAARLDGCGHLRVLVSIYVPVSIPVLATITLCTVLGFWNSWAAPTLYFDSAHRHMLPLMSILQSMMQQNINPSGGGPQNSISEPAKMATVVISTLPILVMYPFLQKFYVNGIMLGSVKG